MKISFCLCLICLLVPGCSSTVELTTTVDVNRKIGESAATVYLNSGQEYEAREVHVRTDSTLFVDRNTEDILRLPTRDIRSIQVAHHFGGAAEGLLFGGLGGGTLGLALTAGMSTSGEEGSGRGLAIFTSLVVGGIGGLVYGAIKGHDYTFVFPSDSVVVGARTPDINMSSSTHQIDGSAP